MSMPFTGTLLLGKEGVMKRWYQRERTEYEPLKNNDAKFLMYTALEDAVQRQLMRCSLWSTIK